MRNGIASISLFAHVFYKFSMPVCSQRGILTHANAELIVCPQSPFGKRIPHLRATSMPCDCLDVILGYAKQTVSIEFSDLICTSCISVIDGLLHQGHSPRNILRLAARPNHISQTDDAFAFGVTLIRGFLKPDGGLRVIFWHAKSGVVEPAQTDFRSCVAVFGKRAPKCKGCCVVRMLKRPVSILELASEGRAGASQDQRDQRDGARVPCQAVDGLRNRVRHGHSGIAENG
ncbi:hypothetical protein P350_26730 [Burkholderia cepacia JBK9]|nr:hypothetical protein P350_26730 [Burkholderia cepacia JBK9]